MTELNQLIDHQAFLVQSDRKCFNKQITELVPKEVAHNKFGQTQCKKSKGKGNSSSCHGIREAENVKKCPGEQTTKESQNLKEEDDKMKYNAKPLETEELEAEIVAAVSIACAFRQIDDSFWPFLASQIRLAAYERNLSDLQICDLLYNKNVSQQVISNLKSLVINDEVIARINAYNDSIAFRTSYRPWYWPFITKTISIEELNPPHNPIGYPSYFAMAIGWTVIGFVAAFSVISVLRDPPTSY